MIDSLKTVAAGVGGVGITWVEALPVYLRIAIGIASLVYVCAKTYKLLKK